MQRKLAQLGLEFKLGFDIVSESELQLACVYCLSPCAHPPVTPEREGEGADFLHLESRPFPGLSCCLPPAP